MSSMAKQAQQRVGLPPEADMRHLRRFGIVRNIF